MHILQGHDSPETAHLSMAYPFGRSVRCVRREWIEKALKGANRNWYRFVTQTTTKAFNIEYSERIDCQGQELADAWARAQIAGGHAAWNAPKPSTYSALTVMVEAPLEDGSGRMGVARDGVHLYCGPKRLNEFKTASVGQLNEEQTRRLALLEKMDRASNSTAWQASDAGQAA